MSSSQQCPECGATSPVFMKNHCGGCPASTGIMKELGTLANPSTFGKPAFGLEPFATAEAASGAGEREAIRAEVINSPETADFMAGVPLEAAHQRDRWGAAHDSGKAPLDWFWLIGYLAQKAATAEIAGDLEKAKHHTISTAAALANWHAHLTGADTSMRPGIDPAEHGLARTKGDVS